MTRKSAAFSSMWVAALCLKACGLTRFWIPARVTHLWMVRGMERVRIRRFQLEMNTGCGHAGFRVGSWGFALNLSNFDGRRSSRVREAYDVVLGHSKP
jgi:hypothetical protein